MNAARPYDRIAVLGAGTMGRGIAIAALRAGIDVNLVDVSATTLRDAQDRITGYLARHEPANGTGPGRGGCAAAACSKTRSATWGR